MATTWNEVNAQLSLFLSDEDEDSYSQALRIAAWNDAQRLLAVSHTPRQLSTLLTMESDERSAVLPDDFLAVWQVYDSDVSRAFVKFQWTKGGHRSVDEQLSQYWVWSGKLYFEKDIDVDSSDVTLYYYAYWPEVEIATVEGETVVIENEILVPRWAELPLKHLTAAVCLVPGALVAARNRQWNIQIDSGTPLHNVRAQQSREHLWWWQAILGTIKPIDWKAG